MQSQLVILGLILGVIARGINSVAVPRISNAVDYAEEIAAEHQASLRGVASQHQSTSDLNAESKREAPAEASPSGPMLVVAMISSDVYHVKLRAMIRVTLSELASDVIVAGRAIQVVVRFAVGMPPFYLSPEKASLFEEAIANESVRHGDLARVNISDGAMNSGKTWYIFDWAARHYPDADLVFKQDDDTIVNWREALPRILRRALGGHTPLQLKHLYVGRLCQRRTDVSEFFCWPDTYLEERGSMESSPPDSCGAGSLYGFSGDVVKWIATNMRPVSGNYTTAPEDMVACDWAGKFESSFAPLDRSGLLGKSEFEGAWVHPVKDKATYLHCFYDRVQGCNVSGDLVNQQLHFQLPEHIRA